MGTFGIALVTLLAAVVGVNVDQIRRLSRQRQAGRAKGQLAGLPLGYGGPWLMIGLLLVMVCHGGCSFPMY